jgi:predicted dithiol-disulfide oxidoreductase (DUF899 family)
VSVENPTARFAQNAQELIQLREEARARREAMLAMEGELQARQDEIDGLREALEGMVYQFGHEFTKEGKRYIGTMGLHDLEWAFHVLGWDEPHPYPEEDQH